MSNRKEFYFPVKREQLLENTSEEKFFIEDKVYIDESNQEEKVKDCISEIESSLDKDILNLYEEQVFCNYFSLLSSFQDIKDIYKKDIIKSLSKTLTTFVKKLEDFFEEQTINQQPSINLWRNSLKINIFFIEWLIECVLDSVKKQKKEIKKVHRRKPPKSDGGIESSISDGSLSVNLNKNKKTKKRKKGYPNEDGNDQNNPEKIDYNYYLGQILSEINNLSNLNIKNLFRNKIIEDELLNLIIKICFDSLEITTETKNYDNKEIIFTLLQTIIEKFQANTNIQIILYKLTTKIVNLIYTQESLVSPLSEFIVLAINGNSNLAKMAVDIIHEVSKTVFEDNSIDSQGLKNVAKFLIILSEKSSKTIYNNITSLISLFDSESYVIRNALVEMMANVIINILCSTDNITDVDTRNNYICTKEKFIDILFDRFMDKSSFCRSKVMSIFEKLCDNNTITIQNYLRLLKDTGERLKDAKSNVRRKAISLISKIISMYALIFKCDKFLTYEELKSILDTSEKKIQELEEQKKEIDKKLINLRPQEDLVKNEIEIKSDNEDVKMEDEIEIKEDDHSDKKNEPEINTNIQAEVKGSPKKQIGFQENNLVIVDLNTNKEKIKEEINNEQQVIDYYSHYKCVLKEIDKIVPLITQLLGSKNVGDVLESIDLFIILFKLRVNSSIVGVKKMLNLIIKSEESIKKRVIDAYRELFFNKNVPNDISAAYIINLASNLNFSEFSCLAELLKNLINNNLIDLNVFLEMWKILLKNPENEKSKIKALTKEELKYKLNQIELESITALKIINEAAKYEPKVLLNNSDLYIKNILNHLNKKNLNWLVIKYSLHGLQKIHPLKKDISEACLLKIVKSIIGGYGKEDNNWFLACKEMINTIFQIIPCPEKICQYLIRKLTKVYYMTDSNQNDKEFQNKFATQNILGTLKIPDNSTMNIENENVNENAPKPKTAPNKSRMIEDNSNINNVNNSNINNNGLTQSSCTQFNKENTIISPTKLAQLIFVVGHVALDMVIYAEKLESSCKDKFHEKNKPPLSKTKSSTEKKDENDEINEIAGGKEAEIDFKASIVHKIIDEDVLTHHLLSKYTKLIIGISHQALECSNAEMTKNHLLYKSAILSLCNLMCINSKFCEENLPFIFETLTSDIIEDSLKVNICCAIGDFINRFPNIMQNQINKFFDCLHSKSSNVRYNAMIVISHLALGDMLKIKGEVVDICLLLQGDDEKLKQLVKLFFHEINTKGNNVIYNIIPKALARLSQDINKKKITYDQFKMVVDELMKYVEKDKHVEGLIDKLFVKIKNSQELIDWKITTYCFSLLNFNTEKNVNKFIEMYSELKDKNDDDQVVKENLGVVFQKFRKVNNLSLNLKNLIDEAEKKIMAGEKFNIRKGTKKKYGARSLRNINKLDSYSNSSNSAISLDSASVESGNSKRNNKNKSKGSINFEQIDEEDEDEEEDKTKKKGKSKKAIVSKKNKKNKTKTKPKNKNKKRNGSDLDEDEEDDVIYEEDDEDDFIVDDDEEDE